MIGLNPLISCLVDDICPRIFVDLSQRYMTARLWQREISR